MQVVLLLLVALVTLVYAVLSAAINAQPTTKSFDRWLAVVQPVGTSATQDQVRLGVEAAEPGAPGSRPELVYSVSVCGPRPFQGLLLIGGDARLTGLSSPPPTTASEIVVGNQ